MLQLVHPEIHGYVGAELDKDGNAVKIVCDVLAVISYVIDSQTSPLSSLVVTFARVDPNNDFKQGGPLTQHMITGLELIEVLEGEGGITIDTIEASVLKTGIPMSHIRPEDLAPYEGTAPAWAGRIVADIKTRMEEIKKVQEASMPMSPFPTIPGPPPEEPTP